MTDPIDIARAALANIGVDWSAAQQEAERLDFKETPDTARKDDRPIGAGQRKRFLMTLAETASCLANSRGGVIVLGIRDRAPDRATALQGVDATRYSVELVRREIYNRTSPALPVDASEHFEDGTRLVLIRVPPGIEIYSTTDGSFKYRVGDQC